MSRIFNPAKVMKMKHWIANASEMNKYAKYKKGHAARSRSALMRLPASRATSRK